jgi:DNA-binding MarR family transcriptional regulator
MQHAASDASGPAMDVMAAAELRASLRRFLRSSEQSARRAGLTPQRYQLLLMIRGAPDGSQRATISELTRRLQMAQSTVTELVQRAQEIGLVEREPSTIGARVAKLRVTAEGERRLTRALTELAPERRGLQDAIAHLTIESPDTHVEQIEATERRFTASQ